jgi:hypothetical protein
VPARALRVALEGRGALGVAHVGASPARICATCITRTSREWRRVAVPFARLRSIDPKSDGRLDLDRVRALVFVVDEASVTPASQGTIWLDEIGCISRAA